MLAFDWKLAVAAGLFLMILSSMLVGFVDTNSVTLAQNTVWATCSAGIGSLYFWRQRFAEGEAKMLMLGIAYVAIGTAMQRGYYVVYRGLRELEYADIAHLLLDYSAYYMAVPVIMTMVGYAFHTRPVWVSLWGDSWLNNLLLVGMAAWVALVGAILGIG